MSEAVEQVIEATAQKISKNQPAPIAVHHGVIQPQNTSELQRTVENIAAGGGFPERFKTPAQRIAAYNLANSLMGPLWQTALNHMAIIHGQLCIYGELPGTLAERTGEVQEKEIYCIDENYKRICVENKNLNSDVFAAVCVIQRKGRAKKEFTYTLDQAKKAGQYPPMKAEWVDGRRTGKTVLNADSPWEKHHVTMMMRKVQALAVKFEFPEALVGVPIAEYDLDLAPDLKDVTPAKEIEKTEKLNSIFSGGKNE